MRTDQLAINYDEIVKLLPCENQRILRIPCKEYKVSDVIYNAYDGKILWIEFFGILGRLDEKDVVVVKGDGNG